MNDKASAPSRERATRVTAFVIAQVAIACVAMGAVSHRIRQLDSVRELPQLRETPFTVEPTYDYPWVVTNEQLDAVLTKLHPRLRGDSPKINHVDHALRFWGVEARFNDPQCLSGEEMRTILTDHGEFARLWGDDEQPLLERDDDGVKVRTQEGRATSSHVDHTLACLAEVGTPADFTIHTPQGPTTMREMVERSLRQFKLNQAEYEWSVLTFALYLPPSSGFMTTEGQHVGFDELARRIMRQPFRQGVCFGNHRLHTLTMLLRIDEQEDILSDEARDQILAHLLDASQRLVRTQHEGGYWDQAWPGDPEDPVTPDRSRDEVSARILATGHALEWLALAPQEVHPPREVLVRAGQWLARTISELDEEKVTDYYTFLTHAGRALALWRGDFPANFLPPVAEPKETLPEGDTPEENTSAETNSEDTPDKTTADETEAIPTDPPAANDE